MNLSEIRTRVADDGNVSINVSTVSPRLTREINRVGKEVWSGRAWSFRWRNYRIVTDTDVTTGTVTATNGSYTITGSAAAFLSSHVGWHIYFPGDSTQNIYQVRLFTSTSQIELDVPYQGTSGSGKTYVLRHLDYVLPTEIDDIGSLSATNSGIPLHIFEPSSIDRLSMDSMRATYPRAIAIFGSDFVPTSYSTGTVSGTIDTATLTGVGTSWRANVYPGDDFTLGSYTYKVRSVESDTSIRLYNYLMATSSGASYTVTRQFGRIARILWPSDQKYVIDIRALRKYAPLINDSDANELTDRFPEVVIKKSAVTELKQQNDRREMESAAERALLNAKAEDDALTPKANIAPIFSYRTTR